MHVYLHTYMHACMHACIHAYMHTCMHAHKYLHAYLRLAVVVHDMHACIMYIHIHCIHTYTTQICTQAYTHTCMQTYIKYMHALCRCIIKICTYMHYTYMHSCIHTPEFYLMIFFNQPAGQVNSKVQQSARDFTNPAFILSYKHPIQHYNSTQSNRHSTVNKHQRRIPIVGLSSP